MKRLFAILCVLMFAVNVYAADIKISELPVVTSVTPATDIVPVVASGATSQVTVTNLMKGANAGTATALAADPADCAAGQVATGIAASGALTCTATPSVTTLTGAVTGTASGNIPNALAAAKGDLIVASANDTFTILTAGATNTLLYVNSDTPAWLALGAANTVLTSNGSALAWAATHSHLGTSTGYHIYGPADHVGFLNFNLAGSTTDKTMTVVSSHTDNMTLTLPDATGTVALVKNEKLASFAWDNGASAVTAEAASKRCTAVPVASTITGWTMLVNGDPGAGGTIVGITKDSLADTLTAGALPTTDIDASAPPTVPDNEVVANDETLTGWTKTVAANDIICATVTTNAAATWIALTIYGTK